jgi:methylglutamate dehydrogenase subunit D
MPEFRPEFRLAATPPLAGTDLRFGANRVAARTDLALVSVAVPLGGEAAVAEAFARAWSLDLPGPRLGTGSDQLRALRTAPDQMMLVFPHPTPDAEVVVRQALEGTAYTTDQTDVWAVLELTGPGVLAALERLCPLDLAPGAFPVGAFARTVMEHMGAMILRTGDERFLLLSASSSAGSFLHAVERSFAYTAAA